MKNKKASAHVYLGSMTILLLLVVAFVVISIVFPLLSDAILSSLKELVGVFKSFLVF